MSKDYHCCATCRHFQIRRVDGRIETNCQRLGYQTMPSYQFNCWSPRPDIVEKMDGKSGEDEVKAR